MHAYIHTDIHIYWLNCKYLSLRNMLCLRQLSRSHEAWKLWKMLLPCSLQKRVRKAPPILSHFLEAPEATWQQGTLVQLPEKVPYTPHSYVASKASENHVRSSCSFWMSQSHWGGVLLCSLQTLWRSHKKVLLFCGLWNFPKIMQEVIVWYSEAMWEQSLLVQHLQGLEASWEYTTFTCSL